MNKDELIRTWENFTENNDFMLNPDSELVGKVADGVLANENKLGFKFCPCRVRDGTREQDLDLLCPCHFQMQKTWENGRCWCGLFVKKRVKD